MEEVGRSALMSPILFMICVLKFLTGLTLHTSKTLSEDFSPVSSYLYLVLAFCFTVLSLSTSVESEDPLPTFVRSELKVP